MAKPMVIYHANCPDGFCGAWVAHKILGDDAEYVPAQYSQAPPDVAGRKVLIVDFSYKRPVMRDILSQAAAVTVLEHHKTAELELAGIVDEFVQRPDLIANPPGSELPVIRFDMNKSGGRLAWEHFFPGRKAPWLVDYTEDRDLWRWALPGSRAINAALASYPRTFEKWDAFCSLLGDPEAEFVLANLEREGEAIIRYQDHLIDSICRCAREVEIGGHKVLAANTSVLYSEVAGKLAEGRPFGAAWFIRSDGQRQWSLRSRDGGVDVSEVARLNGGGGHRNAAGYED